MYVLRIPYRYMRDTATDDEKEVYAYYKEVMTKLHEGTQAGLILPSDRDPETRQHLFELDWIADTTKV